MQSYTEAVAYIERIPRFAVKSSPETTRIWLDLLGEPDRGQRIVHVAGTNGKGSVCSYLAHILREAGYSVGLFTSPHLTDIRERMEVDERKISEEAFAAEFGKVRELVRGHEELPHPAYFEFLFLMAMDWFQRQMPDYLILETGMGGRLDATNTVLSKEMTVITRIAMDHMQYLGDTIPKIAAEKAGILRAGTPAVFLEEPSEAFRTILQRAVAIGAPAYTVASKTFTKSGVSHGGVDFSFCTRYDYTLRARLHTPALYQAENAALAAEAALILNQRIHERGDRALTQSAICRGLERAQWPGRMEEILPGVWLDGAHNPDGFRAFLESVRRSTESRTQGRRFLLFSSVRDKQYREELQMIVRSALFTDLVAVPMQGSRALTRRELEEAAEEQTQTGGTLRFHEVSGAEEAAEKYVCGRDPEDAVYIAGSLYLVGECRALLKGAQKSESGSKQGD